MKADESPQEHRWRDLSASVLTQKEPFSSQMFDLTRSRLTLEHQRFQVGPLAGKPTKFQADFFQSYPIFPQLFFQHVFSVIPDSDPLQATQLSITASPWRRRPPGRHTYSLRVNAERRVRERWGRENGVMAAKRPAGSADRSAARTEPCSGKQTRRRQPGAPCHRIPITRYKRSGRKLQHFTEGRKRDGGVGAGGSHMQTLSA